MLAPQGLHAKNQHDSRNGEQGEAEKQADFKWAHGAILPAACVPCFLQQESEIGQADEKGLMTLTVSNTCPSCKSSEYKVVAFSCMAAATIAASQYDN